MKKFSLSINGARYQIDADPDMPLLWVLRDLIGLTGTHFSCGIGVCGACTVIIDGEAVRSCQVPVSSVTGKKVTTIEGLSADNSHPLQAAWINNQVAQCGYCQPGQIMTAAALLEKNPHPTDEEIRGAMSGVLCRCGTYKRIMAAVREAASAVAASEGGAP